MLPSRSCHDGEHLSSGLPLRCYACEVEDYKSLDMPVRAAMKAAPRPKHPNPWSILDSVSRGYELAVKVFAWLLLLLLVATLWFRYLNASKTVARAGLRSSIHNGVAQVGPTLPPPLCEDVDARECAQLLSEVPHGPADSRGIPPLAPGCSPHSNGTAAARCPRSCGLCAVVLADCHRVRVYSHDACVEGQDVVGEVCANDGDMRREAYCTWMPSNKSDASPLSTSTAVAAPRHFVCAHCVDENMSPERRAMMAQMLELRMEEDGREADRGAKDAVVNHADSIAERDALVVQR